MAFFVGWAALVLWATVTFTLLERLAPRVLDAAPRARRIAAAAVLLAVEAALARLLVLASPTPDFAARAVLALVLAELAHYAIHRAMHAVPLLWRFHRMHHTDEPLAWATAWYVHPIDSALFALAITAGALVAGEAAPTVAWLVVGRRAWTVLLHANLAWPAGPLDRAIATPPFHHRHHREDLPAANFASTLPVIDQLFGTYATPPGARGSAARCSSAAASS